MPRLAAAVGVLSLLLGACTPAMAPGPASTPTLTPVLTLAALATPSVPATPGPTPLPTATPTAAPPPIAVPADHALVALEAGSLPLTGEWRFAVDPEGVGEEAGWYAFGANDGVWDVVRVPHTWEVMGEHAGFDGTAWYRRWFQVPAATGEAHVRLRFDAVFYLARVWLNGQYLGEHEGGYTPFEFDVSEVVLPGAWNVVAVQVNNEREVDRIPADLDDDWSFDWWNWGGIVRDVSLVYTSRAYVTRQRVVAVPHLSGVDEADSALVTAVVTVDNMSADALAGTLVATVLEEESGLPALAEPVTAGVSVGPGGRAEVGISAPLLEPRLWHFDHPDLYRWSVSLLTEEGDVLDVNEVTFGVRLVELKDAQFHLNGEPVRLVGLTRHADSPSLGLAETTTMMARDYDDLKRLNQVFSRPVHYPQHEFILDYCDRTGVLLVPEVPAWQLSARQLGNRDMQELERQQLREMIEAAYNHPSVWAWSIGNEYESKGMEGNTFTRDMIAYVKSLDPTRPVSFASNRLGADPWYDATMYADFVMMNQYFGTWAAPRGGLSQALDDIHAAWPDKAVVISEYGFESRWNSRWGPSTDGLDPEEYYFIPDDVAAESEEADVQRQRVIADQMEVFRSKPFVAAAIFWTYQDYRTPSGFIMGVVDAERNRRGSWEVLREEQSPVLFEAVTIEPASGDRQSAVVTLRARGPVEEDMPAYTLRGYTLEWMVASPQGAELHAEGAVALPALEPGADWAGEVTWDVPVAEEEYVLGVRVVRPTGFVVVERIFDAGGNRLPSLDAWPGD